MSRRHYTGVISNIFGKFASKEFNPKTQRFINNSYVKLMGLDMSKFKKPDEYPTLNALFTRAFVVEPDITPRDKNVIISPCDALVTQTGAIEQGHAYQIKGMEYDISALLGAKYSDFISKLEQGEYVNLYLSPKDYHRYHIPFDMNIKSVTHIPGKLYPVNMPLLKNKMNLFIENERVVIQCHDSKNRTHFLVLVGALNVGKMVVTFEDKIHTNKGIKKREYYDYTKPIKLKQTDLLGWFEMGSTILLFSPKGSAKYSVEIGEKVSYGQEIGVLD